MMMMGLVLAPFKAAFYKNGQVTYHKRLFGIFCLLVGFLCVSIAVFESWILEIREGKALHVYKYNPVYNKTVFKKF